MTINSRIFQYLLVTLLLCCSLALGAAEDPPKPLTTGDPTVSIDELELLLKPLPKKQLVAEASAWQDLLQQRAEKISELEIMVRERNRQLETDTVGSDQGPAAQQQIGMGASEDAGKVALLEQLTEQRENRAGIADRFAVAIEALETKTDADDGDTQAILKDHLLYAEAVSGIEVDVKDTTSAWVAAKGWARSPEGGVRWALNIGKFLGILLAAWIISRVVSSLIRKALGRVKGTSRLLEKFLVNAVRWAIMAVGLIMALAALEVKIGPLLAVVGAAGFVIAFALQDTLSNFASGLMILFFKPFDEGEAVDAGGVSGKVESMNLVSTTIRTFDNKKMIVPNNKIWNDVITNVTGVSERRVDLQFGIGYTDDVHEAHTILLDILHNHPKVLKEPAPVVRLHELADSSVNFVVRPWAQTPDFWDVYWDVTEEVKTRFDAAGIGIPFPQRDVHLYLEKTPQIDAFASAASTQGAATDSRPLESGDTKTDDGGLDDGDDQD